MESQVQDLHEANETAVGKLSQAEERVEELQRANEALRLGQGSQNLDLQEENQRLHDQVKHNDYNIVTVHVCIYSALKKKNLHNDKI